MDLPIQHIPLSKIIDQLNKDLRLGGIDLETPNQEEIFRSHASDYTQLLDDFTTFYDVNLARHGDLQAYLYVVDLPEIPGQKIVDLPMMIVRRAAQKVYLREKFG